MRHSALDARPLVACLSKNKFKNLTVGIIRTHLKLISNYKIKHFR